MIAVWKGDALVDVPDVPMEDDQPRRKRAFNDDDDRSEVSPGSSFLTTFTTG